MGPSSDKAPPSVDNPSTSSNPRSQPGNDVPDISARNSAAARSTTSKANDAGETLSKPSPLLLPFTATYGTLHACLFIQMLGLAAASLSAPQPSPWTSFGYVTLTMHEVLTLGTAAHTMHGLLTSRFTTSQLADRFLVILAGLFPAFQTLLTLFHPPFLTSVKNWAACSAFLMAFGVATSRFPLAHSLVQWVIMTGDLAFLECYGRAHKQQECPVSNWGMPVCLLTQGLVIGAAGLAAWLLAYILLVKSSTRLRSQAESIAQHDAASEAATASGSLAGRQSQQQVEAAGSVHDEPVLSRPQLPFESWGLRLPAAAADVLNAVEQSLLCLADRVSEDLLVRLLCFPLVLYSFMFCLLARVKYQGFSYCNMSSEAFLMYMMAWFMAGRNSSNFDLQPLMRQIQSGISASFARAAYQPSLTELVDRVRQRVTGASTESDGSSGRVHQITVTELLGEGTFGKVYKGMWRGTSVAVKRMLLPGDLMKSEKRERMAIMEAAISGALVHPNIVQTYTYTVKSVPGGSTAATEVHVGDTLRQPLRPVVQGGGSMQQPGEPEAEESSSAVDALEVQLVLEFMDCGTLRDVLDQGSFFTTSPSSRSPLVNYYAVLETAADVAKGMMHLHSLNVIHCDLKARNVLLRSCASDPRSFTAKVGDFGLSLKLDSGDAHVGSMFQGTATHMAPEVHTQGRQSKAADVFSFGITMWELYTGQRPFQGVSRALLGHYIADQGSRPHFPDDTPDAYADLAARCWDADPAARPSFEEVVDCLTELLPPAMSTRLTPVMVNVLGTQTNSTRLLSAEPRLPPAAAAGGEAVGSPVSPGARAFQGSRSFGAARSPSQRAASGQPALSPLGRGTQDTQEAGSSASSAYKGMLPLLVRTAADESEPRQALSTPVVMANLHASCPRPSRGSEELGAQPEAELGTELPSELPSGIVLLDAGSTFSPY